MVDKLDDIKRQLKSGVQNQVQARSLAREAAARLNPEAAEIRDRLDEVFGQIPIADQLRGESAAARQSAVEALEKFGGKSKKPGRSAKSRKKK